MPGEPLRLPLLDAASPELLAAPTTADDMAFWLYSSGSTGAPKGAIHLHSHLAQTAALYARGVLGMAEGDVIFSAAKLFFAYGLGNAMTFPLHVGASAVLLAERPTPSAVMATMRAHQPTLFGGVPTLYAAILADPALDRAAGSARLRASISAGEALPRHVGERWRERFGTDILDGIGSTEMLHIFLSNRPGDVRYGTSGKPVPGYDVKLVGDDGEPVPDGEDGALWVRGPSCCVAYWNQRDKSLATFHGPWTRTGDRYVRDADGYYTYAGRSDDMLKVGGIWVSPFEVESALGTHDAVLEAAVVGHGDDSGLVKPRAFVVLEGRAAIRRGPGPRGRAQGLGQGAPRAVQVPAVDRLHRRAAQDGDGQDPALQAPIRMNELVAGGHRLEAAWIGPAPDRAPTLVFLHEGLGSVAGWRDFPARVASATGLGALVYSRLGYGKSDPVPLPRPTTYMHEEALVTLPEVLDAAGVRDAVLVGHSDGGSIALLFAGSGLPAAARVRALVLEAPHVFVEDVSITSIARAADAYRTGDLRQRLLRSQGDNVDGAFWGWNRAWLDPAFRDWNIEASLAGVRAPALLLQGADDPYGTLAQLDAIERQGSGPVERLVLPSGAATRRTATSPTPPSTR